MPRRIRRYPVTDYANLIRVMFSMLKGKLVFVSISGTKKRFVSFSNLVIKVLDVYTVAGEVVVKGTLKSGGKQEIRIPTDKVTFVLPDKGEFKFSGEYGYVTLKVAQYEPKKMDKRK